MCLGSFCLFVLRVNKTGSVLSEMATNIPGTVKGIKFMGDLIFVGATFLFFAISAGFVIGLDKV
jgi:hypothetical protein